MSLVGKDDIAKVTQLDKLGLKALAKPIMDILKISDVNKVYEKFEALEGNDFIDAILDEYKVEFDFFEEELKRIPKTGPFITVSNHPLGGIDGIILIKLISRVRPDYKVMANFLLQKIEPLKDYFMPVNPFETRRDIMSSFAGVKESLDHVKSGKPLGIFPAGEVSTYKIKKGIVEDKPWDKSAIKFIRKMEVPVVPVYFKARNSAFFYLLSMLNPNFRTAKLPSELRHQKNKSIRIRVGRPISVKDQQEFDTLEHYGAHLRQRTYLLRQAMSPAKRVFPLKRPEKPQEILAPQSAEVLREEIEALRDTKALLFSHKNYDLFFVSSSKIPTLLQEIGRLREITFREVGEGTNSPLDIDEYDYHYHHLILWDRENTQIAGAYRVALGHKVYKKYGIKGFYINTLFKIDRRLHQKMFGKALELGRAFVVKEQQLKPWPLFLLWAGIAQVIRRYPKIQYVVGSASVSGSFSRFSRSLMAEYLQLHYSDAEMAQYIHPRKPFKSKLKEEYKKLVFESSQKDLNKFERLINELEPGEKRFPVLIKKYLKQNGKLVCFNVDPHFNDSLDGFLYIRVKDIPEETFEDLAHQK